MGRVKSLPRKGRKVSRILKGKTRNGYRRVELRKDNRSFCKTVHILVAETYLPNKNNKPTVNHIDGDKSNNRVSNLEWATFSENNKHAYSTGLNLGATEKRNRLNKNQNREIIHRLEKMENNEDTVTKIAIDYGVHRTTISTIRKKTKRT